MGWPQLFSVLPGAQLHLFLQCPSSHSIQVPFTEVWCQARVRPTCDCPSRCVLDFPLLCTGMLAAQS